MELCLEECTHVFLMPKIPFILKHPLTPLDAYLLPGMSPAYVHDFSNVAFWHAVHDQIIAWW